MTASTKVVMVTPFPPASDGIGEHTSRLVGALAEHVDVEVLTARRPRDADETDGVHRLLSLSPRSIRASAEMLRRSAPDVVHHQFAVPALGLRGLVALVLSARLRRSTGTRIVITLHEVRRELDLLRGVGRVLHRRLVALADAVVVHTEEAHELVVRECGGDPESVVLMPLGGSRPGDEVDRPAAGVADVRMRYGVGERPVLLCFGYVHPDKGIEHAIEAVARLRRRHRDGDADVVVLVAGAVRPRTGLFRLFERADRAYEGELRRLVDRRGLADDVRFVGFVPARDVGGLFGLARAVVMPCTKVTQSSVLATATATGTPVVASDLPGLRGALGDGGLLVPPADPDRLADALESVVLDDRLVACLQDRQRRRGATTGIDRVAARVHELYVDILGRTAPSNRPGVVVGRG